ncbi:unnamed protein product [Phyllotreta striolata]|uniref:Uncharacterized protein n=1 Tax=Phyllotreta striolata TaxID=444603 RepID=A0A9N9XKB3_PHYSR|nr:unnamed protein product [Phyllotreta striolata]
MNNGPLPPVPDLIPISALRKRRNSNNNSDGISDGGPSECAPCASNRSEVMGEQRPRRRRSANQQPAVELIDNAGSRGSSAAPQAPLSRKARPERHRKSDRRRERRKLTTTRSTSKHSKFREINSSQGQFPQTPRVNPIFVWVRQEDTRIVDVKCEDYDKRNRILLTKTAQGWRAIPRTETLVPTLKEAVRDQHQHHHHKNKKSRKGKVRRRSTGVQVSSDFDEEAEAVQQESQDNVILNQADDKALAVSPPWMSADNINVESLLPSHTIKVKRSTSPNHSPERDSNVNSVVSHCAQSPTIKCSADKICDVSPLDNLLAVAELEFKQQIQSEEWNKTSESSIITNEEAIVAYNNFEQSDEDKEFMKNLETLNSLIDSEKSKLELTKEINLTEPQKSEECDYNDDDDNNLAMDDILSRLEQSLRSPDSAEINNCDTSSNNNNKIEVDQEEDITEQDEEEDNTKVHFNSSDTENEPDLKSVPEPEFENFFEETDPKHIEDKQEIEIENESDTDKIVEEIEEEKTEIINLVESSTIDEDDNNKPTDLSVKIDKKMEDDTEKVVTLQDEPTDLSIPKQLASPRPPSQNSEAVQSPQPSGIPAVPQSPDLVSTTVNVSSKPKSVFLESLLTNCTKKMALNSEVTIAPQREPLDLGKSRKSASPTVTCSEEINNSSSQCEPPTKKIKSVDITLKTLLDPDSQKAAAESKSSEKSFTTETPKLLELLQNESETEPIVQLKQLLSDPHQDIPDPLLVPKDLFSKILINPGTEIPKLLKERPELRLPQALAYPQIMQDPNMLVINHHHLESILCNKHSLNVGSKSSSSDSKSHDKHEKQITDKSTESSSTKKKSTENALKTNSTVENQTKAFNELANDINTATQASFSQMPWFPYINQMEAMALSNNPDFMKMLSSMHHSIYMNQMPELFAGLRPPVSPMGFPAVPPPMNYTNPLEFNMWQEAMLQAHILRNKTAESEQNLFKNYFEKMNPQNSRTVNNCVNPRAQSSNKQNYSNQFYQKEQHNSYQNPYGNYNAYNSKSSQLPPQNHQRHPMNQRQHYPSKTSNNYPHQMNQNFGYLYNQMSDMEKHQYMQMTTQDQFHQTYQNAVRKEASHSTHRSKQHSKSYSHSSAAHKSAQHHLDHQKDRSHSSANEPTKPQSTQPIDLSGSTVSSGGKLKVKQHLIDLANAPRLLKQHDDVPEVGSTTASIEEMQDAHKHLWHPLFGNQKGYTSPWNWTTVTATGE